MDCPTKSNGDTKTDMIKKTHMRAAIQQQGEEDSTYSDDEPDQNVMPGHIGDSHYPFVLDSGAHISVVPEEAVEDDLVEGDTVMIRDANGGIKWRKTALILLTVGGKQIMQRVALAPGKVLGSKVLLAFDLSNDSEFELVEAFRKKNLKVVNTVLTRVRAAKMSEEQKEVETEVRNGGLVVKTPKSISDSL